MRYSNLVQKIKFEKVTFLDIRLQGSIFSVTVRENQAVSISTHYTMYIITWNKYSK